MSRAALALTPEQEQALADAGLVIVPRHATMPMRGAASQVMRRRREIMGDDWFPASNTVKAGIRWNAMIAAWENTP